MTQPDCSESSLPISQRLLLICFLIIAPLEPITAQTWSRLPVPQNEAGKTDAAPWQALSARQASRDDRWLGLEVRDVIWSPDGDWVYFRWNLDPQPGDDPELDPWFRVRGDGSEMEQLPADQWEAVPSVDISFSPGKLYAAWTRDGTLYLWDKASSQIRPVAAGEEAVAHFRFVDAGLLEYQRGSALYGHALSDGSVRLKARTIQAPDPASDKAQWLETQQAEMFEFIQQRRQIDSARNSQAASHGRVPEIELPAGATLDWIGSMPDGSVLWIAHKDGAGVQTQYMDFVSESGEATPQLARTKVGGPDAEYTMGWLVVDGNLSNPQSVAGESADPHGHFILPEDINATPAGAEGETVGTAVVIHPPQWSPDGRRAVLQIASFRHKDRWIVELDWKARRLSTRVHDHDDAWLGGPPPVAGYLSPAYLAWLDNKSFAFASERSGWSHLYRYRSGRVTALTKGDWEVRDIQLSQDRGAWLITASKDHASDDHLYRMAAGGGKMARITRGEGRHNGTLSPSGNRVAFLSSDTLNLPDLFLVDFAKDAAGSRITQSGTENFFNYPLIKPELVSFPHPDDGKPVWGMVYLPPHPNGAGLLHIHGGGYRQFTHRGWSVYGFALHVGTLNYLLGLGYTVLDFDYRGGAGYGRDYRADIYRDMGNKDITGALPAIDHLVTERGVDRDRIGVYGISYGGFFTLAALFNHPGVFAAGIANASVTDWAHYNDIWTSRILNLPTNDPEAYLRSSPINNAAGLADPLLIVHGLMDDNVQFQDVARLTQRLIELEKPFEMMVYPIERHTIKTESSRFDYVKRVENFFARHLLDPPSRR